jgi:hypothetical protein
MTRRTVGVVAYIRDDVKFVLSSHCILHRVKRMLNALKSVLDSVVKKD